MKNELNKVYVNKFTTENKNVSVKVKKDYLPNMKRVLIIAKINQAFQELAQKCNGQELFVNEDKYRRAMEMFVNSTDSLENIFKQIELAKQNTINSYNVWAVKQMRYQVIKSHKAKTLRR